MAMQNLPPKMTPELFAQLLSNVKPVDIHGFIPQKAGMSKDHKDDEPVHEPAEVLENDLNDVPLRWFSLAPLYCALGPKFNLLKDFSHTAEGGEALMSSFKVPYPLMPALTIGTNVVEGIDHEHWEYLRTFLAVSGFTKGGKWWLLTENVFDIKQEEYGTTFPFTVFTPVSSSVGVYSYQDMSDGSIKFYQGAGNPLVDKYAAVYNTSVKGAAV